MRHQNTVFHDAVQLIPWTTFDRLVEQHGTDRLVRKFNSRHQLLALLFGQFSGATSLREIESSLESHKARLYHVGGRVPCRSTFADANRQRDASVFSGLFAHMLAQANRQMKRQIKRQMGDVVRLIDSTGLHLAGIGTDWARFSTKVCGAKAHVVFDPDAGVPVYHAVTPAKVNDITAAKAMPIERGATYVFDLGYYDFAWWAALDAAQCRIVTRFKTNTPLVQGQDLPLDPTSSVLSDRIGFLPLRQTNNRRNPMGAAVREITVKTETGKVLRIFSNDLDAPAQELADLYKRRWMIELFFRLMKQTLRIRHFIGRSENAVRTQIAVALIAFLILHTIAKTAQGVKGFLDLARLVHTNLMHRKDMTRLRQIQHHPPINCNQMELNFGAS